MAKSQQSKMVSGTESATLEGLTKLQKKAPLPLGASESLSNATTATIQNASPKIWSSAELVELRSKAGLVAGALADFQAAGGIVTHRNIEYILPSGIKYTAVKLLLIVRDAEITVGQTADGLDFDLVAEKQEAK